MKIIVVYAENGIVVPDMKVQEWVDKLVTYYKENKHPVDIYSFVVGSEVLVGGIRVAVSKGLINHEDIVFMFDGEELQINKDGRLSSWPVGFCDTMDHFLETLLGWKIKYHGSE